MVMMDVVITPVDVAIGWMTGDVWKITVIIIGTTYAAISVLRGNLTVLMFQIPAFFVAAFAPELIIELIDTQNGITGSVAEAKPETESSMLVTFLIVVSVLAFLACCVTFALWIWSQRSETTVLDVRLSQGQQKFPSGTRAGRPQSIDELREVRNDPVELSSTVPQNHETPDSTAEPVKTRRRIVLD